MPVGPVVDARVRLPDALRPAAGQGHDDGVAHAYRRIFGPDALPPESTPTQLAADLDESGIGHAVVHAEYEHGDIADELIEAVAQFVRSDPRRYRGIGTVSLDPLMANRAIRQLRRCSELGLLGVNIQPAFFGLELDDPRLYAVYASAADLGLIVAVHTGINYAPGRYLDLEHPMRLDRVMTDLPELTVIAAHAGWPWAAEMTAVARRHPNLYLEFGGIAPKYVSRAGGGWDVMRQFIDTVLCGQALFATDWPMITPQRALAEWEDCGIRPSALEQILSTNALNLFGITPSAPRKGPPWPTHLPRSNVATRRRPPHPA